MRSQKSSMFVFGLLTCVVAFFVAGADAQNLSGEALIKALRQGGYAIVMRHASSPRQAEICLTRITNSSKSACAVAANQRTINE
jgi:hypothetical protein